MADHSGDTTVLQQRPALADRFDLLRTLGDGAAGSVYLVRDRMRNHEEVALKVLINDDAFDEHTLRRFQEEMKVCQELCHPNIIEAYDFIDLGDTIAYTMEHVKGCDLGRLFHRQQKISYEELDHIFIQLLSALQMLHQSEIVHRDLKLENILIGEDGLVKLSDLGLMKRLDAEGLTRAGVLLGTAQYMPPEYIKAGKYDGRSDLYAVGILLFELTTGRRRLTDKNGMEAIEYLIKTKFEIPRIALTGLPKKYVTIINRALEPKPNKRYQTAQEMAEDFKKSDQEFAGEHQAELKGRLHLNEYMSLMLEGQAKQFWHYFFLGVKRISLVFVLLLGAFAALKYFG